MYIYLHMNLYLVDYGSACAPFWGISHSWPEYQNFQIENASWVSILEPAMLSYSGVYPHTSPPSPPEKTSFGSCWAAWVRGKFLSEFFCRQTVITVASRVHVFDSRNHAQVPWRLNPWKLCDILNIGAGCLWASQESSEQWLNRHLLM